MTPELPAKCRACGWDSAKRYSERLQRDFDQLGGGSVITPEMLFGPRPEHTCGRTSFAASLGLTIGALRALRAYPDDRNARSAAKKWLKFTLDELEMTE